ncbi:unnamed protein product, partial [Rotaria sp. Silwood2]
MEDRIQAEANLNNAQLALDEAERELKLAENAEVKDQDAIDKARNYCQHSQRNVNQMKNTLDNSIRVLTIREKTYTDVQALVNSIRQQHQEATDSLTHKEEQLANQNE